MTNVMAANSSWAWRFCEREMMRSCCSLSLAVSLLRCPRSCGMMEDASSREIWHLDCLAPHGHKTATFQLWNLYYFQGLGSMRPVCTLRDRYRRSEMSSKGSING